MDEKALKKQFILEDICIKVDKNIQKYIIFKKQGKQILESLLNSMLSFKLSDGDKSVIISMINQSYKEIDTILYGLNT